MTHRSILLAILALGLVQSARAVTRSVEAEGADVALVQSCLRDNPAPRLHTPFVLARGVMAEVVESAPNALGGWSGRVRITSAAGRTFTRRVQVVDVTPPAPHHTLFIHGPGTERLRAGCFTLRNLPLPADLATAIQAQAERAVPGSGSGGGSAEDAVDRACRALSLADRIDSPALLAKVARVNATPGVVENDSRIKDLVDNRILQLNPRLWGRVRTNGVLEVCPPVWAPDDVLNYTGNFEVFGQQRPEIGFPGCDNRLHDPYFGVYTHYEGAVYKT